MSDQSKNILGSGQTLALNQDELVRPYIQKSMDGILLSWNETLYDQSNDENVILTLLTLERALASLSLAPRLDVLYLRHWSEGFHSEQPKKTGVTSKIPESSTTPTPE